MQQTNWKLCKLMNNEQVTHQANDNREFFPTFLICAMDYTFQLELIPNCLKLT